MNGNVSIKEVSGKILLYIYQRCRSNAVEFENYDEIVFDFGGNYKKVKISGKGKISKDIKSMGHSDNDLYEAIKLLNKSGMIEPLRGRAGIHLANIQLTPKGYEIIEGIERGAEEKKRFFSLFNIKIDNKMSVDSLLKITLDNISVAGVGVAASGKVDIKK